MTHTVETCIYIYRKVGFDAYMPTAQYVEPCTIPSVILSQRCASKLCFLLTCCAVIGDVIHTLKIKVGSDNPLGASAVSLDDVVAAHMAVGGSAPYTARVRIYCFKTNLFLSYFRALSRSLSFSLWLLLSPAAKPNIRFTPLITSSILRVALHAFNC